MRIDVLTLFPEFMSNIVNWSIIKRSIEKNKVEINNIDIRDFSKNKHKKVDDYPFGGGQGMVMTPEPIYDAIESIRENNSKVIYLSPQGETLTQSKAIELSKEEHLILLCGHYEGIDNRIIDNFIDEEISIGDYVMTGGEIPAMVVIDTVVRLIPGVLSSKLAYSDESHYYGLLEYPQYTRPRNFLGISVPETLLSGNHKKIQEWRIYESLKSTLIKRPDLLEKLELTEKQREILSIIEKELK